MGKRTQKEKEPRYVVPIYIPTEEGAGELALGIAVMRGDTLSVQFNDKIPAQAIKARIARGDIVGLTFVIPDDEAAEAKVREDEIQQRQDEARLHVQEDREETDEERETREAEEEAQAKVDAALLEAELERLED